MQLYPAIDLKDGQCVRLLKGDMKKATVYSPDPAAQAETFAALGFQWLHVVDLNGAVSGSLVNRPAVEAILKRVSIPVQLGGGIRSMETIGSWLEAGVRRVVLGTVAVQYPALVKEAAKAFPGKIAVGIDARGGMVATHGWAQTSELRALELAKQFEDAGVAAIIYTDIARDGTLSGPNIEETATLARAVSIPVILSGGMSTLRDIAAVNAQKDSGIEGIILGRALYEKTIDPKAALQLVGGGMSFPVRIIPCLDVKDGRVVKGVNFVNLVDAGDPVEQAKIYDAQGADELCFLDITATSDARGLLLDMVERVAATCFMPFTVGGGVRSLADIRSLLLAGADKVSINSGAVARPEFVREAAAKFGSQCIVVAIDAKQTGDGKWEIFTHGGRKPTGIDAIEWAEKMEALGAGELLVTSMDRDGSKDGYDTALMHSIATRTSIPLIASGGVGSLDDFAQGARSGATGLLAASVFHFGEFTIPQVKEYLSTQHIAVRKVA